MTNNDERNYPLVSIVIATYNSASIIRQTMDSIRMQDYPADQIEIIAIDGGSKDGTRDLMKEYGAIVLDNPKGDPGNAKLIGREHARGIYILTLDHDEVFENPYSVSVRIKALQENPECKVAFCAGYKCPTDSIKLNEYSSDFGDPFSLFYYHNSLHYRFFFRVLKRKAVLIKETEDYYVFDLAGCYRQFLFELGCFGTIVDKNYFSTEVNWVNRREIYSYAFYDMMANGDTRIIVSKNDPVVHYSVSSLKSYMLKLRWRIINNVHLSAGHDYGFYGRDKQSTTYRRLKKYFFPLYSFTLVCPLVESICFSISRKNAAYLWHFPLSIYVAFSIVFQYILKLLGIKPQQLLYDGSKSKEENNG